MVIKKSNIHGKGVFSTEFIKKDTILTCDVLPISGIEPLLDYAFPFIGTSLCIHIGFASFLNSSKNPNVKHLRIDTENLISYFKVLEDTKEDTELTLHYI